MAGKGLAADADDLPTALASAVAPAVRNARATVAMMYPITWPRKYQRAHVPSASHLAMKSSANVVRACPQSIPLRVSHSFLASSSSSKVSRLRRIFQASPRLAERNQHDDRADARLSL